jgi:Transposase DNA-binding/Transposase DDE domain
VREFAVEGVRFREMATRTATKWAREEFGAAQLGDVRRTRRLVEMAASAADRPSGKVSVVFERMREREGAYDFLERGEDAAAVADGMFRATAARTRGAKSILVSLDITSLSPTDDTETKEFGPVGSPNVPVRGLMVANALAVSEEGVPLGLIDQRYWVRGETSLGTVGERTKKNRSRPFEDKQGAQFVLAAAKSIERLGESVTPWFVIDREGDSREILSALRSMRCRFTIRGTKNRRLSNACDEANVRESLALEKPRLEQRVDVGRAGGRKARTAIVEVLAKKVALQFKSNPLAASETLELYAVWVREVENKTKRADALDWILYTNAPIDTDVALAKVVASYRARWRVEEFHRTWKQGHCNIEDAQLRSIDALVTWAVILAAVATRIERLKYLSRNTPDEPASIELDDTEIEALKIERRARYDRRTLTLPEMPTIHEATGWIAEMGGWVPQKSSGPPGSITLARGIERLAIYVRAMLDVRAEAKISRKKPKR